MGDRAKRKGTMHPAALEVWRHPLFDLIVSDERREWILSRYPFEDVGRPGILASTPEKKLRHRKNTARQDSGESPGNEHEELAEAA